MFEVEKKFIVDSKSGELLCKKSPNVLGIRQCYLEGGGSNEVRIRRTSEEGEIPYYEYTEKVDVSDSDKDSLVREETSRVLTESEFFNYSEQAMCELYKTRYNLSDHPDIEESEYTVTVDAIYRLISVYPIEDEVIYLVEVEKVTEDEITSLNIEELPTWLKDILEKGLDVTHDRNYRSFNIASRLSKNEGLYVGDDFIG